MICPLIEESDAIEAKSAMQIADAMQRYFKDQYHVGLLHGGLKDEEKDEVIEKDIELAIEWSKSGGIVSYKWHWYSPNRLRSVKTGAFDIYEVLSSENIDELYMLSDEELELLHKNGHMSDELYTVITDIDKTAEYLSRLNDKKAVTLFEPLPDPDSGLYWWGDDPACYKKLYALIFNRLCIYHRLSNLVFVYNGSGMDYYPGTNYCDIVGQSFFEQSDSAFAGRFYAVAEALPTNKMLAVTACDVLTSEDNMNRDNAFWLFSAIESGKYLINENGIFVPNYNTAADLRKNYNSTIILTRDELPDISKYAI